MPGKVSVKSRGQSLEEALETRKKQAKMTKGLKQGWGSYKPGSKCPTCGQTVK